MRGIIFDIKRFAVHDGDDIRTTVFLKGCPLNCKWCHNPEGIGFNPILAYCSNKCINCGQCIDLCPNTAHKMSGGKHIFDRNLCDSCGKCVQMCIGDALKLYGREITTEELLPILLEDKEFYLMSGGFLFGCFEKVKAGEYTYSSRYLRICK